MYESKLIPISGPSSGHTLTRLINPFFQKLMYSLIDQRVLFDLKMVFGTIHIPAFFEDDVIKFKTPPSSVIKAVMKDEDLYVAHLMLSLNGGEDFSLCPSFYIYKNPSLYGAIPQVVIPKYHREVIVTGSRFFTLETVTSKLFIKCRFGSHVSEAFVRDGMLICPFNKGYNHKSSTNSLILLSISLNNGQDFSSSTIPIIIKLQPIIFDIFPRFVSASGSEITLTGVNLNSFKSSNCFLQFRQDESSYEAVAPINVNSSIGDEVMIISPAGSAGKIEDLIIVSVGCTGQPFLDTGIRLRFLPLLFVDNVVTNRFSMYVHGGDFKRDTFTYSCIINKKPAQDGKIYTSNQTIEKIGRIVNETCLFCNSVNDPGRYELQVAMYSVRETMLDNTTSE